MDMLIFSLKFCSTVIMVLGFFLVYAELMRPRNAVEKDTVGLIHWTMITIYVAVALFLIMIVWAR